MPVRCRYCLNSVNVFFCNRKDVFYANKLCFNRWHAAIAACNSFDGAFKRCPACFDAGTKENEGMGDNFIIEDLNSQPNEEIKMHINKLRSESPLTDADIMKVAPSVFNKTASPKTGARYKVVTTDNFVMGLRQQGFYPFAVSQAKVRDQEGRIFAKHALRFRRSTTIQDYSPEIVIVNSHDGASSYQIMLGVYRLVCANGLMVGSTHQKINVRHSGNATEKVIEGVFRVEKEYDNVLEKIESFKALTLSHEQMANFATKALMLKYPENAPIRADSLIKARRQADTGTDLWSVLNVVQENLIAGGLRGVASTGRRITTRPVRSIAKDITLNRAVWDLAESIANPNQLVIAG